MRLRRSQRWRRNPVPSNWPSQAREVYCHNDAMWLLVLGSVLGFITGGGQCLADVHLVPSPSAVPTGSSVALLCQYDLQEKPLYAIKWYKGQREIYRCSPSDIPSCKILPIQGIEIDLSSSNSTQVVLLRAHRGLTGTYRCEVTADQSFSTKTGSAVLIVAKIPDGRPIIYVEKDRYEVSNILNARCSVPQSIPPANMTFLINDFPVMDGIKRHNDVDNSLKLQLLLTHAHFSAGGRLTLKCVAQLAGLYQETAEVELGERPGPVPQMVTSENNPNTATLPDLQWLVLTVATIVSIVVR